jgi:hypothetical protein
MSLLTRQTSSLLGIGEGSIKDFAQGVRARRKGLSGMTREEALRQATAAEGQDARLRQAGNVGARHDPKATQGARLKLTTDDRNFIQAVQSLEKKIFKGEAEIGKNATRALKGQVQGLLELGAQSSRGGIAEIWSNVYERIQQQGGRTGPQGTARLQKAFSEARAATNKVLDTELNIAGFTFEEGRKERVDIGDERAFAQRHRQAAARGTLKATQFYENPAYQQGAARDFEGQEQLAADFRLNRGQSLRELSRLTIGAAREPLTIRPGRRQTGFNRFSPLA